MISRTLRILAPAALAAVMFTAAAPPSSSSTIAGPPWVSIEYPPSPYDRVAKTAFLLVHSYHHFTAVGLPVNGTAEGIVNGQRKTVKLEFQSTSKAGVYALRKQWPDDGTWTLVIRVTQGEGEHNTVTALVDLGANGKVASVDVPTEQGKGGNSDWTMPKAVSIADVDAVLRRRAGTVATRGQQ